MANIVSGCLKVVVRKFRTNGFFVVSTTGLSVLLLAFLSECHTWELDAVFSFKPLASGFTVLVRF